MTVSRAFVLTVVLFQPALLVVAQRDLPASAQAMAGLFESINSFTPVTPADSLALTAWHRAGIEPSKLCSDAVFVRRVFLDVIGTLPTADEVTAFLNDQSPTKRDALIDRLLARDEFADYWAMKWCDLLRVKSEFPINLWPNAVQSYHHWIRDCVKRNVPYDRFVDDLLTSNGSNFRKPPVNFFRAVQSKEPTALAQAVALTFMGARADRWPTNQLAGMAAFFSQIGFKSTSEWKEEIVYFDPGKSNAPTAGILPDGTLVKFSAEQDPREAFAHWLITPKNPWFTRNLCNRVWAWLLGRGIIHEPDDIRDDNPASNPALLAYLQREFVASQYDLKQLYRLILRSRVYQLSAIPKTDTAAAAANFAFYPVRRLEAEVLIDAINQVTGGNEEYISQIPEPFTHIPEGTRAIALADASVTSSFLELFGRSSRDTGLESERNTKSTVAQRLHLLNSSHIQRKIETSQSLRALMEKYKAHPRDVVDALYLTILSRYPTDEELAVVANYKKTGDAQRRVGMDLAWALLNSAEFQYRH